MTHLVALLLHPLAYDKHLYASLDGLARITLKKLHIDLTADG